MNNNNNCNWNWKSIAFNIIMGIIILLMMEQYAKASPAAHERKNVAAYSLSEIVFDPKTPAKYLYMYQGNLTQRPMRSKAAIKRACGGLSELGCAFWTNDRKSCEIVYMVGKPHVYWHEIAHCNGMLHD